MQEVSSPNRRNEVLLFGQRKPISKSSTFLCLTFQILHVILLSDSQINKNPSWRKRRNHERTVFMCNGNLWCRNRRKNFRVSPATARTRFYRKTVQASSSPYYSWNFPSGAKRRCQALHAKSGRTFKSVFSFLSSHRNFQRRKCAFSRADRTEELLFLHSFFGTAEEFAPHVTLLSDKPSSVYAALPYIADAFHPFQGMVSDIQLYEFHPAKSILSVTLKNNTNMVWWRFSPPVFSESFSQKPPFIDIHSE